MKTGVRGSVADPGELALRSREVKSIISHL
jgi:hypothetical protein